MSLFGKRLGDYARFARAGMILIVLMGLTRFIVGISGVPYERATNLVSITFLTMLLSIIYGQKAAAIGFGGYRHLLPTVFMLAAAMYGFIIVAIFVEGWSGFHGYFHGQTLAYFAKHVEDFGRTHDHFHAPESLLGLATGMNTATHAGG